MVWTAGLSEREKRMALRIARDALEARVRGTAHSFDRERYDLTSHLEACRATFVTFRNGLHLRGCMGTLQARESLCRSIWRSASNAAADGRFARDPIGEGELADIRTTVSVLEPLRTISEPAAFHVGEHGVWLAKGGRGAVFLPEVATEQGWSREETLAELCLKAGLRRDDWREGASLAVFGSEAFSETM
jgi:AmmeMemoRadiSam system protein A